MTPSSRCPAGAHWLCGLAGWRASVLTLAVSAQVIIEHQSMTGATQSTRKGKGARLELHGRGPSAVLTVEMSPKEVPLCGSYTAHASAMQIAALRKTA